MDNIKGGLLKEREAANYIGMSRSFLAQGRMKGKGPIFCKVGRSIRYRLEDLDAWIQESRRINTVNGKVS